ncbi:UNVERIFIED_CONTAM: Aspartic proteinase Asp1 [Sesamum radiatum]|uniref:Aspartic proteinase Asp1 n=1 Tax=Sesamum radiatum TaxID=300843 RepID=A0AAW2PY11_SESRA
MHQKLYLRAVVLFLLTWIAAAAYQPQKQPKSAKPSGSSVIFPVSGNVYPKGPLTVFTNQKETLSRVRILYVPPFMGLGSMIVKHHRSNVIMRLIMLIMLRDMGLTRNVVGHCLSGKGGGFLFFGDDFLPKSGIVWKPISSQSKYYSLGPADLQFGGQATNVKGLPIVFDSGSTYTYFSSQAYKGLVSLIKGDLNGKQLKDAVEDRSLPVCWKGAKAFKSIREVVNYFKPLVLNFTNAKNIQLQLRPESYLIVTEHGNVCLGILDGGEVGLGNINVIGALVGLGAILTGIFCLSINSTDRDIGQDLCVAYAANDGMFGEVCPASFGFWRRQGRK